MLMLTKIEVWRPAPRSPFEALHPPGYWGSAHGGPYSSEKEAREEEASAHAAINRIQKDNRLMSSDMYSISGEHIKTQDVRYTTTSAETAAARRKSMDLSKELAQLRKRTS